MGKYIALTFLIWISGYFVIRFFYIIYTKDTKKLKEIVAVFLSLVVNVAIFSALLIIPLSDNIRFYLIDHLYFCGVVIFLIYFLFVYKTVARHQK